MRWVRNPVVEGNKVNDVYDTKDLKNTPSLWNVSLDDAIRFGGDVTRSALSGLTLIGDRKHVTVDTKIHMLMPGMIPAIPGWHTDGVPRQHDGTPSGGSPLLQRQEELDAEGKAPHYHLLISGDFCSTEFLDRVIAWDPPGRQELYAEMTSYVSNYTERYAETYHRYPVYTLPGYQWVTWDWWNIHRAVESSAHGWRFLIRVTESDFLPPQTDPREFIRTQNQVYIPMQYGW